MPIYTKITPNSHFSLYCLKLQLCSLATTVATQVFDFQQKLFLFT